MAIVLKKRKAIGESKIEYVDLSINPVLGCSHACSYCYARLIDLRYGRVASKAEWHRPKVYDGFIEQLKQELERRRIDPEKEIFLSTMTDLYQPLAADLKLGRQIIELLKQHNLRFRLLTKSPRLLDDKDILAYKKGLIGLSITTNSGNESARKKWEPGAPAIIKRLEALKELSKVEGINLWVSAEPFLPGTDFEEYFKEIFEYTGGKLIEMVVGKMNYTAGVDPLFDWEEVVKIIESWAKKYPNTRFHYKKEFLNYLKKKSLTPVDLGLVSEEEFSKRQTRIWINFFG